MRRPGGRAWLVLALALALGIASALIEGEPPRVSAHALLVRAEPPVNAQLRDPPTMLTLYFSEAVERKFSDVRVLDQNNNRVDDRVEFDDSDDALMRVYLKPLQPGFLTVDWETVSAADGHRVTGSYPLTILNPDGGLPPGRPSAIAASTSGGNARPDRVADHAFALLAACLMLGSFAFLAFITPQLPGPAGTRTREALEHWAVVIAGGALIGVMLFGGLDIVEEALTIHGSVSAAIHSSWGHHWLIRQATLLLPLLALEVCALVPGRPLVWRLVASLGVAASSSYLALWVLSSHAVAGGGSFWATASDFVHLVSAGLWLGTLALLFVLFLWVRRNLQRGERFAVLGVALRRFSLLAVVSVAALLVSGTANGLIEVGSFSDLIETGYGRSLALKLALMLPLLLIAAANGYLFRPSMATHRRDTTRLIELEQSLTRWIRWELIFAVAVIAAAALLGQNTPTRGRLAAPKQGSGKFTESITQSGIGVTLVVDPNQPGDNSFEVYLTGDVGSVESVRLDFTPPGASTDQARLEMDPSNPPTFYVGKGPYLPNAGKWGVAVDLRRSSGTDLTLPFTTEVTPPGGIVDTSRGGGALAPPISFTLATSGILTAVGLTMGAMILGSVWPRGRVGGYTGVVVAVASRQARSRTLRPVWSLTCLLVVGVGFGLIIGGHLHKRLNAQQAIKGNPVPSTQQSVARGQVLFSQNCTICHGDDGKGDGPLAKSLPLPPANLYLHVPYHPDQFFFDIMTNGLSGVMPSFVAKIGPDDRWNILNYMRATYSTPPP